MRKPSSFADISTPFPEPSLMLLFFISGAFSALFAILIEVAFWPFIPEGIASNPQNLAHSGFVATVIPTFLLIALIEESAKFSFFRRQAARIRQTAFPVAGIALGLGFGLVEMAIATLYGRYETMIPPMAAIGLILLHVSTATAYGFATDPSKNIRKKTALLLGISIHFAYDILLALL